MIKTKKWKDAEAESSVTMCTEDWMADEIDGLREELRAAYKQRDDLLKALKSINEHGGRLSEKIAREAIAQAGLLND